MELGVEKIVTSCPMCERMLGKASNGEIEVVDIVEVVDWRKVKLMRMFCL